MFANAGLARYAALGSITEELYNSIFDINVKGNPFTMQKALPLPPDGPSIILNASVVGQQRVFIQQRLQYHKGCRRRHEPGTSRPHIERSCICAPITVGDVILIEGVGPDHTPGKFAQQIRDKFATGASEG